MNAAIQTRLRFIDFLLDAYGHFNRSMLCDYFGISIVQASLDIKAYIAAAPSSVVYNKSAKMYAASPNFVRTFE